MLESVISLSVEVEDIFFGEGLLSLFLLLLYALVDGHVLCVVHCCHLFGSWKHSSEESQYLILDRTKTPFGNRISIYRQEDVWQVERRTDGREEAGAGKAATGRHRATGIGQEVGQER